MLSKIEWLDKVPLLNETVFATIKIDGYADISNWSMKITNVKNLGRLTTISEIEFLMNEIAPVNTLSQDTRFDVLLGSKKIANGKII